VVSSAELRPVRAFAMSVDISDIISLSDQFIWRYEPNLSVRSAETLASFKHKLKTYLFIIFVLTGFHHLLTL